MKIRQEKLQDMVKRAKNHQRPFWYNIKFKNKKNHNINCNKCRATFQW